MTSAIIAILLPSLLGFLALSLLLAHEKDNSPLMRMAMSFPLGMSLVTLQLFLMGLLRIPFTLQISALLIMLEVVALAVVVWIRKAPLFTKPASGLLSELSSPSTPWPKKAGLVILALWAAAKICSVFVETDLRPLYAWDSWANWSTGAKSFYFAKGLLLDTPTQDLFGRGVVLRIMAYPPHNHLMQVWLSLWVGHFDEVLVKMTSPFYYLSAALFLYALACREISRLASLALLVMFMSSPLMSYHAIDVYSDFPLGVTILCVVGSFYYALRGNQAYWILTGIASAQAIFIKEEALFLVIPIVVSSIAYLASTSDTPGRRNAGILSLLTPFIAVLPWYIFKFRYGLTIGAEAAASRSLTFHPEVIIPVFQNILTLENFNIIILAFPLLLILNGRPSRVHAHLILPVLCYMAFFLLVYAVSPLHNEHLMSGTIFYRNVLTYYPALCLLTALLIKNVSEPKRMIKNISEPKKKRAR